MAETVITNDQVNDGVASRFWSQGTISFEQVTVPIWFGYDRNQELYLFRPGTDGEFQVTGEVFEPAVVDDSFTAQKVILTGQDDFFEIGLEMQVSSVLGGDGNDTLINGNYDYRPSPTGPIVGAELRGEGGDDVLLGGSFGRDHLSGGNGSDVLMAVGNDEMSGGSGADRFIINEPDHDGGAFLADLVPGEDVIDLYSFLQQNAWYTSGNGDFADFSDARADGVFSIKYQNGYTYLYFNGQYNGAPAYPEDIAHIKGSITPDRYDDVFKTSFGDSYYNQARYYDRVLDGTGNLARDHLTGGSENDLILMGDTDEAGGHGGLDRFVITRLDGASAFVTDGRNDLVDLTGPLADAGFHYAGFTEAEQAGTLGLTYRNGYTLLSFDTDGDHTPDHEFLHMKGIVDSAKLDHVFLVAPEDHLRAGNAGSLAIAGQSAPLLASGGV